MNHLRRSLMLLMVLASLPVLVLAKPTWPGIKRLIHSRFPSVEHLTQAQLRALPAAEPVLLLDVRATEEFAVSQLRGALHTPTTAAASAAVKAFRAQTPHGKVVVYCSVGYRSAQIAQSLQRAGLQAVYNLEGGIFEWANAGLPVEQQGRMVAQVHPFDTQWGSLLQEQLRYAPPK
jgi:rhodanese-related sulfurtransferase